MSQFTFESEMKKEISDFNKELDRLMLIYGFTDLKIVFTKKVGAPVQADITTNKVVKLKIPPAHVQVDTKALK